LVKAVPVVVPIRLRVGPPHTLRLPLPRSAPELRKTQSTVVAEIDRLIDTHTDVEIAEILNARSLRPGGADRFGTIITTHIRQQYRLESRFSRLRQQGMLTLQEMTAALGLDPGTVKKRATRG